MFLNKIPTSTATGLLLTVTAVACPERVFKSCCDAKSNEFTFSSKRNSSVYNITNFCGECGLLAEASCDSITFGGGWTVIQRRVDGSANFDRNWTDYEFGFGKLTGDFWYGLCPMHCLTSQGSWEVKFDMTFINGTQDSLHYSHFAVGPVTDDYRLNISSFTNAD